MGGSNQLVNSGHRSKGASFRRGDVMEVSAAIGPISLFAKNCKLPSANWHVVFWAGGNSSSSSMRFLLALDHGHLPRHTLEVLEDVPVCQLTVQDPRLKKSSTSRDIHSQVACSSSNLRQARYEEECTPTTMS